MTDCPPLAVYSLDRGPISSSQFVAFFVNEAGGFLCAPVVTGESEAHVRAKAVEFWAKHGPKSAPVAPDAPVPEYRLSALAKARAARSAKKAGALA